MRSLVKEILKYNQMREWNWQFLITMNGKTVPWACLSPTTKVEWLEQCEEFTRRGGNKEILNSEDTRNLPEGCDI